MFMFSLISYSMSQNEMHKYVEGERIKDSWAAWVSCWYTGNFSTRRWLKPAYHISLLPPDSAASAPGKRTSINQSFQRFPDSRNCDAIRWNVCLSITAYSKLRLKFIRTCTDWCRMCSHMIHSSIIFYLTTLSQLHQLYSVQWWD
jgi:hypothetical protein